MLYPHITVDDVLKSGWIGDDIQLQPKIKVTQMKTPGKIIIGNTEFIDGIPISAQTGTPVEEIKQTWYDRHGLPNPDRPDQIVSHRAQQEKERQEQRENALWDEVSKKFKANIEVAEVENDKFYEWDGVTPQCVTNFGEIKIGFKNGE